MKAKTLELMAVCMATALYAQISLAQQTEQSQSQSQQPGQTKEMSAQASGSQRSEIRLKELMGTQVTSKAGENLGKVEDLMVDPATGKIRFAILARGGILGMGEKRIPVPWQAVTAQSEKQLTLNVDKQKMLSAPTVKSDYSELQDPAYVVSVYKFYEIQPLATGAPGETPGGAGAGMGKSQTNAPPSNP